MAVDTAAKRASAIHLSAPWRGPMVVPSGTIDDSERAAAMFLYSGFDYTGGIPAAEAHDLGFIANIGKMMGRR